MYRYEVYKTRSLSHGSYGLLAKEKIDGNWIAVAVAAPFSDNYEAVYKLAESCSSCQLSPTHLIDVVSDFISQIAMMP